jgi:hypothetical protein
MLARRNPDARMGRNRMGIILSLPRARSTGKMTKNLEGERTELTAGGEKMTRFSRRQSPFGLHHHHPPGRGESP